ncbi:hypothetical protein J2Y86_005324 [Pseudomonas migulae]|uniref:hypothetical protein n=1 Tax=Pseudomonas migulae TaxID=78543 RepID=UPI00209EA17C|nr:hypothetical protein [Pseudomonas migulae]MCP1500617.1 hypothetical protein [Pseudomonas migulae]
MSFEHIKVVKSVDNDHAANRLLGEGWELLAATGTGEGMLYILGQGEKQAAHGIEVVIAKATTLQPVEE